MSKTTQLCIQTGLILLCLSSCMGKTFTFDGHDALNITSTSDSLPYKLWKGPSKSILKIYIFNYTNVDEYERGEAEKLHVEEIGPFVYEELLERVNLKFHENGTVSYQEHRNHRYRGDLSKGRRLDDQLVVPNVPMLSAAAMCKDFSFITRYAMSTMFKAFDAKPFINLSADQFIWGYDDRMSTALKSSIFHHETLSFEKFGLLVTRNGTSTDVITINTGETDLTKLGLIDRFNGKASNDYWSTDDCNSIQGSDGTVFPPFAISQKKPVYMYMKELCRRLPLVYSKEVKVFNGTVPAYRYVLPDTVFDSPEINPENQCYCCIDSGDCSPQGLFNATLCAYGAPSFISFPHFYKADPAIREAISGLNPEPEDYENYVDVHPSIGLAMAGKSRFQMNVQVKKTNGISQLDMFDDTIFLPIAWLEVGLDYEEEI